MLSGLRFDHTRVSVVELVQGWRSRTLSSRRPITPGAQREAFMSRGSRLPTYLSGAISPALFAALSLATTDAMAAPCSFTPALTTQTKCVTAIHIPGNPLRSFDISFVNPQRGEYYLADRSNAGIDVIDTHSLTFKRTIGGFVGIVLNSSGAVNNNKSGPDGVVAHGR